MTAYLARFFQGQGQRVAILSRGYGGRRREVTCLSDGERLFYRPPEVGEEAFELGRASPASWYTPDPAATPPAWPPGGSTAPIFFSWTTAFSISSYIGTWTSCSWTRSRPFGNGRLLPAGPLREPLTTLREADVLILSRYDDKRHQDRRNFLRRLFPLQAIFTAAYRAHFGLALPRGRGAPSGSPARSCRPGLCRAGPAPGVAGHLGRPGGGPPGLHGFPGPSRLYSRATWPTFSRKPGHGESRPWSPPPRTGPVWARSGRRICLSGS